MDNANNSSIILGLNKQDQIKALREVGFTDLADNATWSEIVVHMRWAGGLRDIQVAAYLKSSLRDSSPQRFYFSEQQWQTMTINEKSKYVVWGIAIRAERMAFVLALQNATSGSTNRFAWGPTNINVPGLKDFGTNNQGVYDDIDGEANTDLILACAKEQGVNFPAAEAARAYKAFTKAADSTAIDDPTKWSLPAFGQLRLFYKYMVEIDKFLTNNFGSSYKLTKDWHWSSTEWDASGAWFVGLFNGGAYGTSKANTYYVRAVAAY